MKRSEINILLYIDSIIEAVNRLTSGNVTHLKPQILWGLSELKNICIEKDGLQDK